MVNPVAQFDKSTSSLKTLMPRYFVRIGSLSEIHASVGSPGLQRGRQVILRTERGVEVGEVAGPCDPSQPAAAADFQILRPTTEQDDLLIRRLDRHKREAVEACRAELSHSGSTATLLDVDQLFDGGTLVMHFLGPVDAIAESITKKVADRYESIVRSRHFAKLLSDGCGPDCGTKIGECGGGCTGCTVASACQPQAT
jgi:hypothetical protein